jgi:hypothetical protein
VNGDRWQAKDWRYQALAMLAGVLLAVLPHLATRAAYGTWDFLADLDDVFYAEQARPAYHGEFEMRDPQCRSGDHVPSPYAWWQYVPWGWLTRSLGLPLTRIVLLWRLVFGGALGGVLYAIFRYMSRRSERAAEWALGLAVLCLSDFGFGIGPPIIPTWRPLACLFYLGRPPYRTAQSLVQFRVTSPLCTLPFLLLLVHSVGASERSLRRRGLEGVLYLSILVALYPYFWVAGAGALVGYGAMRAVQRRPRETAMALGVVAAALLLNLPSLERTHLTASIWDSLQVQSAYMPLSDPRRLALLPNETAWGALVLGLVAMRRWRVPDLAPWWWLVAIAFSGYASAAVTGRDYFNFHFILALAPAAAILLLSLASRYLDAWPGRGRLWLVPALFLALAVTWRPFEALRQVRCNNNSRLLQELDPMRPALQTLDEDSVLAGPAETAVAMLFGQSGQLFAHYLVIAMMPPPEVEERYVLNCWLMGMPSRRFQRESHLETLASTADQATLERRRLRMFLSLDTAGRQWVERYHVRYLLLPASSPTPHRGGPWVVLSSTDRWTLYTR